MKTFTPQERAQYLAARNRKLMSSTMIFLDAEGQVLILETTYKTNWEVPGGGVEKNESPIQAAIRETKEELGITITNPKFLGVDYRHTQEEKEEMMHFVFFGGVLTHNQIADIILQEDEVKRFKFANLEEVKQLCGTRIGPRVERALTAISTSSCIYHDSE